MSFSTPNGSSLRHLVSGALATTVSRVVDVVASALFYLILSRVLGAGRFGLFALALTVVKSSADFCRLGVDQSAMRFIAQYRAHDQRGEVRAAARFTLTWACALSAACMASLFAVKLTHFSAGAYGAALSGTGTWLLLALPWIAVAPALTAILRGAKELIRAALIEGVIQPIVCLLGACAAALVWPTETAFALGFLLSWVAASALGWHYVHGLAEFRVRADARVSVAREMLPASLGLLASSSIYLLLSSLDVLLLGYFQISAEVGHYVVARKVAQGLVLVQNAFSLALAPMIPQYLREGGHARLEQLWRAVTRWGLMLSLPPAVLVLLCPQVFLVWFGKDFTAGGGALVLLTCGQLLFMTTGAANYLLLMSGHTRFIVYNALARLLLSVMLYWVWIPRYGAAGAALANLCAIGLTRLAALGQIRWKLGITVFDAKLLKLIAATCVCALSLYSASSLLPLWAAVAVAAFAYVASIWGLGLKQDAQDAWRTLARSGGAPLRAATGAD